MSEVQEPRHNAMKELGKILLSSEEDSEERLSLTQYLTLECQAMARHALRMGAKISAETLQDLEVIAVQPACVDETDERSGLSSADVLARLARSHNRLVDLVAPASPSNIMLLASESERRSLFRFLGPVPLVRRLMIVALISLVCLVVASLSPDVNGDALKFSLLKNSGMSLFRNQLFLLAAASLGASFSNLSLAHTHLKMGNFDSRFESTYWIRHLMGMIAGTVLACLVPIETFANAHGSSPLQGLEKPTLAMLAGFSASLVYRMLSHIMLALETLLKGDSSSESQAQSREVQARASEQRMQSRIDLATKLTAIQRSLRTSGEASGVADDLDRLLVDLMGGAENENLPSLQDSRE